MKSHTLSLLAIGVTLLTVLVLHGAGWFSTARGQGGEGGREVRTRSGRSLPSAALLRYSQGQPRHWRQCMLAH